MPNIPLVMCTYNHIFVKIKHKIQSEKCEDLRLLKSRIFRNNIRIKIKEIGRLKLHIPTNISFGTEMKFKIKRTIKYTDIRNAVSVCAVTGTWSHLRLSQHTLKVQTMSLSVDRALCFPSGPRL